MKFIITPFLLLIAATSIRGEKRCLSITSCIMKQVMFKICFPSEQPDKYWAIETGKSNCYCEDDDKQIGNVNLSSGHSDKACDKNQRWTNCSLICKEKLCVSIILPNIEIPCDTTQCTPGCECIEGFYRDIIGGCIAMKDCPEVKMCPPGETFTECDKRCELSCEQIQPESENSQNKKDSCLDLPCQAGCTCLPGRYRHSIGFCMSKDQCKEVRASGMPKM